ncbi:hypothetical protein Patl1_14889 [Pistacia atlantica]|uniref:Uncharacterized protein n=1 Tax=Pistacia atlantica TaxID=434234 RepID=A0ACC1AUV6_9ROSI|nr:hypothetical protein Patl1_14889 [Pistacia atlantica]
MDLFILKGALVARITPCYSKPSANWTVVEVVATAVGREVEKEGAVAEGLVTTVNRIVIWLRMVGSSEFRLKELDLIRMKWRGKRAKSTLVKPKSKLLFIIRIQGKIDMHPKTRKTLYRRRLTKIFSGVFAMASEGILE